MVKRFLQAYSEGIYQFVTNKEKALAITNQRLKQKNTALVEEAYQFYGPIFSFPPRVSHDGVRVVLEMIAQRNPGTKFEMNVDKYVDERLLDELEREGLFQRISGKGLKSSDIALFLLTSFLRETVSRQLDSATFFELL